MEFTEVCLSSVWVFTNTDAKLDFSPRKNGSADLRCRESAVFLEARERMRREREVPEERDEWKEDRARSRGGIPVFCSWAGEPNAPSGEPPYPRAAKPAASPEPCCCACCTATAWACATTAAALHAARPAPKARNPHALS